MENYGSRQLLTIRRPPAHPVAVLLAAIKARPGSIGVRFKTRATGGLDSLCAMTLPWGDEPRPLPGFEAPAGTPSSAAAEFGAGRCACPADRAAIRALCRAAGWV